MQNQYPPQGYGQQYPPQGYPPQGPPHGHSPYPPQHPAYGGPPPPQGYTPQQQPYGQPPPGQYGAPPPPPGAYGQQSPQPPYGAPSPYGHPPPGQYNSGPPLPPSMGYVPGQVAPVDMSREADGLRAAMKGFGTDEKAIIAILPRLDPLQIAALRQQYHQRHHRNLIADLESETGGYFRDALVAMVRGPLEQDVYNAHRALEGLGTKETLLNDVLLSRSNADLNAIKALYHQTYRRSLEADVKGDLSMKTERLFAMVLSARRAEETAPVIPQAVDADVSELYRATEGTKVGADSITVCQILSSRSDGQIRAISQAYQLKYHRALHEVIKKSFSGHMEDALIFMLSAGEDRAKHDATLLEAAMKGPGTKDDLLVNRLVRIHWDRQRMIQCKGAYKHFFKKELLHRVEGETSGDYKRTVAAIVNSA